MTATNGSLRPTKETMKAQQFDPRDQKLHLNEVPIPKCQPHELLIQLKCASLCHSDVMLFEPNDQGLTLGTTPVTLGHEGTGIVVEAGSSVNGFNPGDKVGFMPAKGCCFECEPCLKVHNTWCRKSPALHHGFAVDGFFAEYVCVDAQAAMVLPANMDVKTSAPLFCAGVTSFHGIEACGLQPGQWVAVIGCGGLGHLGIKYSKAMGYKVIGLDITTAGLEEAKDAGADHVFNSMTDKDYVSRILEITSGGVDAAVNFTASRRAYDDAPQIIKPGTGVLTVVGIPRQNLEFKAFDLSIGRFQLRVANNGTPANMRPCIEFSAKHNIKPDLTVFKLEELPNMIDLMHSGKAKGRMGVQFD